jgi:hypothetical protein
MSTPTEEMEIVNFPVPKRYLPAVVHALSTAMQKDDEHSGNDNKQIGESAEPSEEIDWTRIEQCKRLRRELRATAALTLLDLTATKPNKWVSFNELVEASGRSRDKARGDLVALTKAVKRIYRVPTSQVRKPFETQWKAEGEDQAYYRMSDNVAQAWKQSAAQ